MEDDTLNTTVTNDSCNNWAGVNTRTIEFNTPGTPDNTTYEVCVCTHWSLVICGAYITNVQLFWEDCRNAGHNRNVTSFANPTVHTNKCPDDGSDENWCEN